MTLACGMLASPAHGQRWQVDLGGARVAFDSGTGLNSVTITPFVEWNTRAVYAAVGGGIAVFEGAQWTAYGRTDLSLLLPLDDPARVEIAAAAAGTRHSSAFRTAGTHTEVRLHLADARAGVGGWVGAGVRAGWSSAAPGVVWGYGPTAGGWASRGAWRGAVMVTPIRVEGRWFPEFQARVTGATGPLDIAAYGGWRGAEAGSGIETGAWGGASVTWWVADRMAVVAGGGSYPAELLQGLPRGSYVTIGIRLAAGRPRVAAAPGVGRPAYDREQRVLAFRLGNARQVAVAGDWNRWRPEPMKQAAGGRWVLDTALAPGVYRFNLVVDGQWIVPNGVPSVDDGFGGRTGILVVP